MIVPDYWAEARIQERQEGRQILADIYGWFTEGFGTADLESATALLAELR